MLWAALGKAQTQASAPFPTVHGKHCPYEMLTDGMLKEPQASKTDWKEQTLGFSRWALDNEVRRPLWTRQKH